MTTSGQPDDLAETIYTLSHRRQEEEEVIEKEMRAGQTITTEGDKNRK